MLARPSIERDDFFRTIVVTTWHRTKERPEKVFALSEEQHVWRDRFLFGLSRTFDWAKDLRWALQERLELGVGEKRIMSRNNAMRPPLAPLEFLDYYSASDTDIIQEYFVPIRSFVRFMDDLRRLLTQGKMNVLSATIRYVRANDEVALSYAPREDAFAIIQMSNVGLSPEAQASARAVTRRIVDAAIAAGGTYYLTYQLYPTRDQLVAAYPRAEEVFARKRAYDPQELFMSRFYSAYAHPAGR
jgi:FAD/FMN-containing dehydrogenase